MLWIETKVSCWNSLHSWLLLYQSFIFWPFSCFSCLQKKRKWCGPDVIITRTWCSCQDSSNNARSLLVRLALLYHSFIFWPFSCFSCLQKKRNDVLVKTVVTTLKRLLVHLTQKMGILFDPLGNESLIHYSECMICAGTGTTSVKNGK